MTEAIVGADRDYGGCAGDRRSPIVTHRPPRTTDL